MRTFFLIYGLRWFTWLSWHFILICILTPLHTKWRHGPLSFPSLLFTTAIYVMWQKKWQLTISKSILFNLSHRKTFVQQNNSCHFCINGTTSHSQWIASVRFITLMQYGRKNEDKQISKSVLFNLPHRKTFVCVIRFKSSTSDSSFLILPVIYLSFLQQWFDLSQPSDCFTAVHHFSPSCDTTSM